ncbi:MAG: iron ABC transporter permease [Rhodocyclaceae bacterium]|nr:iron ABC transporter permease [Rhodocyclaceae bacterium]MBX3667392.1 iron ABC transporter permease [Rhodocyclaceae bacterium]
MRPPVLILLLVLLSAATLAAALATGSSAVSLRDALAGDAMARAILLELRVPRAAAAYACGGLLALSGVLMQALLRNPLADPYVLGISGGAATFALVCIALGLAAPLVAAGSFAGAVLATALVFALASVRHDFAPARLLLTGVVLASGWGAAISLLLALAPPSGVQGMVFWLLGDLSAAQAPGFAWAVLLVAAVIAFALARSLNLLARGAVQAGALGVDVANLRRGLHLLGSACAAVAVSSGGSIGFVGLVVPHLLRLTGLRDHRWLVLAAPLAGGALLTAADTAARTLIAPQQLPVGVLTTLLGVPLFLWLLRRDAVR